ncbi:MAG: methyltransferase [Oscillospiraceae bacterium]|nr:methyltransferase [Oscillospiraceae bacterium]MCR4761611.1 methyltransferase [Oscillospiraceae bacterium]
MNCVFEELKKGLYVCRSEIHSFGTDAFLLTGFSCYREKDRVCDLGTGCGIIPLLMQRVRPPQEIFAVDIQADAIRQLNTALERCDGTPAITPVCADLRDLWEGAPLHQLDLVTCNPPYKATNAGILSDDPQKQIARHEIAGDIGDICAAAAKLLKYHGRFCLCCRPERLADVMCAMRASQIEPKRLRLVCKTPESAPWLFLLEGKKFAKPFLKIEPTLFVRSGDGMTSEAAQLCHFGEGYT